MIDPLQSLDFVEIQSFDIKRLITVYPDRAGLRWWTKAWFNNSDVGEWSVEITRDIAIKFIHDEILKNEMLEAYYPEKMKIYRDAINKTREQLFLQQY